MKYWIFRKLGTALDVRPDRNWYAAVRHRGRRDNCSDKIVVTDEDSARALLETVHDRWRDRSKVECTYERYDCDWDLMPIHLKLSPDAVTIWMGFDPLPDDMMFDAEVQASLELRQDRRIQARD